MVSRDTCNSCREGLQKLSLYSDEHYPAEKAAKDIAEYRIPPFQQRNAKRSWRFESESAIYYSTLCHNGKLNIEKVSTS
ncbi:hypothetical protein Trydic_g21465 [Trypoxylus dichotomus]